MLYVRIIVGIALVLMAAFGPGVGFRRITNPNLDRLLPGSVIWTTAAPPSLSCASLPRCSVSGSSSSPSCNCCTPWSAAALGNSTPALLSFRPEPSRVRLKQATLMPVLRCAQLAFA